MKILLVNKAYYPHSGGVETVVRQIAEGMRQRGNEATVLCFGNRDSREEIGGVKICRVRPLGHIGSAPAGLRFIREFFRLSKEADVINLHSPNPMGEAALLLVSCLRPSFLRGKKIICTYHGDAQRPKVLLPFYDALLRRFLGRCDGVVVSSPPLSGSSRVLKAVAEKISVVPIGVRTRDYAGYDETALARARWLLRDLPLPSFRVMFAGRMVYYKGLEVLMEAMRKVKLREVRFGKNTLPICAFLVGSGPEERDIKRLAVEYALGDHVLVLPHQPEKVYRALFGLADCFVLPSTHKTEAYGIVLAEAMASGLPVVSTELGTGTSWVNLDGETGIVVPPGDSDALAEAMIYLADHQKERKEMAAESLARSRRFFEESAMLDTCETLFRTDASMNVAMNVFGNVPGGAGLPERA
ncbi:MAG: glycosyltransferase [Synergistaceae bacterium]|jgi:rhamnosyl/mannosyltransferase|nr:glycosyltransferase [Synergistaceae bacterium]